MATRIGQMAQEFARMNPWWRSAAWASIDPDLRAAEDTGLGYRSPCLDELVTGGLYLLRGPRRVGKTVSIKQTIERLLLEGTNPRSVVRLAADTMAAEDLRTVVQNAALPLLPEGERRWWFFDEVTAVTGDWAGQLKWLRDNDPDFSAASVVLTGSNAAGLTEAAGVLAGRRGEGRHRDRTLLPLGFHSVARLLRPALPERTRLPLPQLRGAQAIEAYHDLLPWLDDLVIAWETYVGSGGFPVAVAAACPGQDTPDWFVDDMFDVVFKDAFAASRLSRRKMAALHERLMTSTGSPANFSKIGHDLDLTYDTVARHVGYLRDAYLLWDVPQKAEASWTGRERAQNKIYAIDPLVARLAYLHNAARADIDLTVLTEMQIGLALHRADEADGAPWADEHRIFHMRTPARKEIDFVAEGLTGVAVEGKYVETGKWRGEAATVNASGYAGILVTRNVLDTNDEHGAWAVPAGILAYLIDT